jgi:predicted nucleotidyltransferase component of viral defense system
MFQLTQAELQGFVAETGFQKNPLEKFLRLLNVLAELRRNPLLKEFFVLKGGTALNLFHHGLLRLSVDIDLNYIHQIAREQMFLEKPAINSEINKLFAADYTISIEKDEHALTQFALHYRTMAGSKDMLKIEINYLHRLPILKPLVRTIKRFGMEVSYPCLALEELLAGKIIALLSRYTPRDLYDVYQTATSALRYDSQRLRSLILFYGLVSRVSVFELFRMDFDRITQNDLRRHLTPLLAKGRAPERVEMVGAVEKFLKPLLALTQNESAAVEAFYTSGALATEALFLDAEMQNKVKSAPSLLWKMQNIHTKNPSIRKH